MEGGCSGDDGLPEEHTDSELSTIVIDHIVQKCNAKDLSAAVMNIEGMVAWIRVWFPEEITIWLLSAVSRTYENNVILVMLPFICRTHGFQLEGYIHPETA